MANKKEFSREDVSEIMRRRINAKNERIEQLEFDNEILRIKLEQMEADK